MPNLNVNNINLNYEVHGQGVPILFIHPPGMGLVTFNQQIELSRYYKIITLDLRGNGKSDVNHDPITIPLLAEDICELVNKLGLQKVVICGYSNGGSIALEFALRYPERTLGMILLAGFSEVSSFLLRREFELGMMIAKMNAISLLSKALGFSHTKDLKHRREIEQSVLCIKPEILFKFYKVGLEYNCTSRLSEINVPVLAIDGKNDYYLHKYQNQLRKNVKNITNVWVDHVGHQVPTKRFSECNTIIKGFMDIYYNGT